MTSGTPWPFASGARFFTKKTTTTAPITGANATHDPQGAGSVWRLLSYSQENRPRKKRLWKRPIRARKANAPTPATTPNPTESIDSANVPRCGRLRSHDLPGNAGFEPGALELRVSSLISPPARWPRFLEVTADRAAGDRSQGGLGSARPKRGDLSVARRREGPTRTATPWRHHLLHASRER